MKMFSVFLPDSPSPSDAVADPVAQGRDGPHISPIEPASYLAEYVIKALNSISVTALQTVYKELGPFPDNDIISLEKNNAELMRVLTSLAKDESYFTLGCPQKVLIIPFELWQFNFIVGNSTSLPSDPHLEIMDSTEVLRDYADAYEGFGVATMFPGEGPA